MSKVLQTMSYNTSFSFQIMAMLSYICCWTGGMKDGKGQIPPDLKYLPSGHSIR